MRVKRYQFDMRCPFCKTDTIVESDGPPAWKACQKCKCELFIVRVTVIS